MPEGESQPSVQQRLTNMLNLQPAVNHVNRITCVYHYPPQDIMTTCHNSQYENMHSGEFLSLQGAGRK